MLKKIIAAVVAAAIAATFTGCEKKPAQTEIDLGKVKQQVSVL